MLENIPNGEILYIYDDGKEICEKFILNNGKLYVYTDDLFEVIASYNSYLVKKAGL